MLLHISHDKKKKKRLHRFIKKKYINQCSQIQKLETFNEYT